MGYYLYMVNKLEPHEVLYKFYSLAEQKFKSISKATQLTEYIWSCLIEFKKDSFTLAFFKDHIPFGLDFTEFIGLLDKAVELVANEKEFDINEVRKRENP